MNVIQTTKTFLKLFVLQAKPNEVPYSKTLLVFLSIVFLLTKSVSSLWFIHIVDRFDASQVISLNYLPSLLVCVVWLVVLFAILRTTLLYYHLENRFVQVATSIVAMDCLLSLVFLIWLVGLEVLPLPTGDDPLGAISIIVGFVLMMYWQFMVYIHILVYSFDLPLIKAGVYTLFYMLLQHNLSELLLNVVISVQDA